MKKQILIFAAGLLLGGAAASGVFLTVKSTEQKKNDPVEFFPPTFTKEYCRHWNSYARYLLHGGYNHTNWDMSMASGLGSFLTRVELYIFMNEKARSLQGDKQKEFVAKHRQWLKWWKKASREPVRDHEGNIIEGTMAIPLQASLPGELLEEYLAKFPDRAKLEHDYVAEYEKRKKQKEKR